MPYNYYLGSIGLLYYGHRLLELILLSVIPIRRSTFYVWGGMLNYELEVLLAGEGHHPLFTGKT